jgi:N-acetylglucosamine kinase-like BadF-type ATPase
MVARTSGMARILAVDGGASKTDVALIDAAGHVLGARRLPLATHAGLDRAGASEAIDAAIASASRAFGLRLPAKPIAEIGVYCLAGADLPVDDRRIGRMLKRLGWTTKILVRNDTLAVLRAGSNRGWGVAVVCGSGMNAIGVGPDGRVVRYASFGEISGDLAAGGGWIGAMALAHAVRAEDGRGPATALARVVPAYFKLTSASTVTEAIYLGRLSHHRLVELAPRVFDAALQNDRVAREILDRVADEVVAFAGSAIKRLGLRRRELDVVLGGGVFRARDRAFHQRIERGIQQVARRAVIRRLDIPPVVGGALIGLDQVGASPAAVAAVRRALTYARLSGDRARPRTG